MKPFMVNSLAHAFERNRIMLSPFDELIHKQLIDYRVERIGKNGMPQYCSENEHFVDALGLAYLAFVLEFPQLTKEIQKLKNSSLLLSSPVHMGASGRAISDLANMEIRRNNPWRVQPTDDMLDPRELDKQKWIQVPMGNGRNVSSRSWGSRTGRNVGKNRRMF